MRTAAGGAIGRRVIIGRRPSGPGSIAARSAQRSAANCGKTARTDAGGRILGCFPDVLQGMTKRQITWIAKQALPMFYLMIVAVLLIWYFPQLITFLPQQMKLG